MPLKLTGRHMDVPEDIQDLVRSKVDRFHKYHGRISLIEVTIGKEKREFAVDIIVKAGKGEFLATESHVEMRGAVEVAADKIEKQMEKRKSRMLDRKRSQAGKTGAVEEQESVSFVQPGGHPAWVHPEQVELAAYTVEEALEKLNGLDHREFFVFRHSQSGELNVIFKRKDGLIGLIET